jgi:S1-C subfamily serine protease
VPLFPQLVDRFDLPTDHGVWVQAVNGGGPASDAGLKAGTKEVRFQVRSYRPGGDIITAVDGEAITNGDDLSQAIAPLRPGQTASLTIYRGKQRRTVRVKLGERPGDRSQSP